MKQSCSCVDGNASYTEAVMHHLKINIHIPEDLDGKAALSIYIFAFWKGERKLMKLTQLTQQNYVIHLFLF